MYDNPARFRSYADVQRRLRIAYVIERVVTLTLVVALCARARHVLRTAATGELAYLAPLIAFLAVAAFVVARMTAPLWLWTLIGRNEPSGAARRSQTDGLESAVLAVCGLAFGVSYAAGAVAIAVVVAIWVAVRRFRRNRAQEIPFASSGSSVPAAAVAVAEQAGFPPTDIIVDQRAHAAARTIRYEGRCFILLAPHVPQTYTDREIAVIVAHELAHVKRHDLARTRAYRLALCLAAVGVSAATVRLFAAMQSETPAAINPVALAAGVASIALMEMLCLPVLGWLSRRVERNANRWALQQVRDPDAFISAMTKLHSGLGSPPEPAWWSRLLAQGHPSLGEILAAARRAELPSQPDTRADTRAPADRPRDAAAGRR